MGEKIHATSHNSCPDCCSCEFLRVGRVRREPGRDGRASGLGRQRLAVQAGGGAWRRVAGFRRFGLGFGRRGAPMGTGEFHVLVPKTNYHSRDNQRCAREGVDPSIAGGNG